MYSYEEFPEHAKASTINLDADPIAVVSDESMQIVKQDRCSSSILPRLRSPEVDLEDLQYPLKTFDELHCMYYLDPHSAPFSLGLTYGVCQPALLHAYAACGALILCGSDHRWKAVSIKHQSHAANMVSATLSAIEANQTVEEDWLMATVNALHIFEVGGNPSRISFLVLTAIDSTKG